MFKQIHVISVGVLLAIALPRVEAQTQFGDEYEGLTADQKRLVDDWMARFSEVTGQNVDPGHFYDTYVKLSTKTTFDAMTHALGTSNLSGADGASLGTALDLVERMETVHGKVRGAGGDQQFRMYVVLKESAIETLERSVEFKRGTDNTIYHKGYPVNYRQQGGIPSIQISIARDERRADIDVDYRSSSFPVALFNGHLSSSNSDVRAGDNDERHSGRWEGFRDWWSGLFGIRLRSDYDDMVVDDSLRLMEHPRVGKKTIEKMMYDFMHAWLIEGNVMAALSYISERAYPCLVLDGVVDELDRGMAPFILMNRMKAVKDVIGQHDSLEGLALGVRLNKPELKLVRQPHHAQFVIYSVRNDVAASFDCASRLELEEELDRRRDRDYGDYFGSIFYVYGPAGKGETVALLWGKEDGYWKIVSYEGEPGEDDPLADLHEPPEVEITTIAVDQKFAATVKTFFTQWFIEKNYDAAFRHMSPKSYSCYNLYRNETVPEASSPQNAASYIRDSMARAGKTVGQRSRLDTLLAGVEPSNPIVRIMRHADEQTYTLTSLPNAIADLADCATRARDEAIPDDMPLEYGATYGASFRFRTKSGETPVYRTLWVEQNGQWRVTSYDVEEP